MATKYRISYKNAEGEQFDCFISNDDYSDEIIFVQGYCIYEMVKVESHFDVLRGSGLQIILEGNPNLTFEEFFTSAANDWKVELIRDSKTIFVGLLDQDGFFEDYVSDRWEITLNATGPLGLLKDLSFVDENGLPFRGQMLNLDVVRRCLSRVGIDLRNIVVSVNTRYFGLANDLDPLANTICNAERFYKDDGETIMSCKEVLESVLFAYAAVICQYEGDWHIFSAPELPTVGSRYTFTYKAGGPLLASFISKVNTTPVKMPLGSKRGGFYPHWCNDNQQRLIEPAKASFRLSYKYGFVNSLIQNEYLYNDGSNLEGFWNVQGPVTFDGTGSGVEIEPNSNAITLTSTENIGLFEGDTIRVYLSFIINAFQQGDFFARLRLEASGQTYYLEKDGTWNTSQRFLFAVGLGGIRFDNTYDSAPLPEDGNIYLDIYSRTSYSVTLIRAGVSPIAEQGIQGETHTSYVVVPTNSKRIVENREINVGDNLSDVYVGALYEFDGNSSSSTNTTIWSNSLYASPGSLPILKMLSIIVLAQHQLNRSVFTGDVYGEIVPHKMYTIEGVNQPGSTFPYTFLPMSINYNTKTNVTNVELRQVIGGNGGGVEVETSYDYGNVQTPTIKS